jgi:hypothetical protein
MSEQPTQPTTSNLYHGEAGRIFQGSKGATQEKTTPCKAEKMPCCQKAVEQAAKPEELTAFDSRKLRKKYNFINGEMVQTRDVGANHIADTSTWQPAVEVFFRFVFVL